MAFQPQVVICDMDPTENAIVSANDIDDEDDTNLPPGWVEVIARRVVENPAAEVEREQIAAAIAHQVSELPEDQQEAAFEALEARASYTEPELIVQKVVFHLSPGNGEVLQKRLGLPDWV